MVKALARNQLCNDGKHFLQVLKKAPAKQLSMKGRKFKEYRGMGSLGAMATGNGDRYFQDVKTM